LQDLGKNGSLKTAKQDYVFLVASLLQHSVAIPKRGGAMLTRAAWQMLWNWNTIDSCFITSSWRITSTSVFAGSCIGVLLLVISLELIRRSVKEYDRFLIRQNSVAQTQTSQKTSGSPTPPASSFRPTIFQQAIRAFLHMVQFAVAYFVMLYDHLLFPDSYHDFVLTGDYTAGSLCTTMGTSLFAYSSAPFLVLLFFSGSI
jgi:hypothetical protein